MRFYLGVNRFSSIVPTVNLAKQNFSIKISALTSWIELSRCWRYRWSDIKCVFVPKNIKMAFLTRSTPAVHISCVIEPFPSVYLRRILNKFSVDHRDLILNNYDFHVCDENPTNPPASNQTFTSASCTWYLESFAIPIPGIIMFAVSQLMRL